MYNLGDQFKRKQECGKANEKCIDKGNKYRITVLSERLIRLEYSENGQFLDAPTELVWNRVFEEPKFAASASSAKTNTETGFAFRTAESFLNNITKKVSNNIDFSSYQSGARVYHKKFGEGTINYVEPDISVICDPDKLDEKGIIYNPVFDSHKKKKRRQTT